MNDTTKSPQQAPWCPHCGGELVSKGMIGQQPVWTAKCRACGFPHDRTHYTHKDEGEVIDYARRRVRAELARQALEMRAHGRYVRSRRYDGAPFADWPSMEAARVAVSIGYNWLGKNPLRLPGEAP